MKAKLSKRILLYDSWRDQYDYDAYAKIAKKEINLFVKPFTFYRARSEKVYHTQISFVGEAIKIPKSRHLPIYNSSKIKSGLKVEELEPLAIARIRKFMILTPYLLTQDEINGTIFGSVEQMVHFMKTRNDKTNENSIITYCKLDSIIVNYTSKFAERVKRANRIIQ